MYFTLLGSDNFHKGFFSLANVSGVLTENYLFHFATILTENKAIWDNKIMTLNVLQPSNALTKFN